MVIMSARFVLPASLSGLLRSELERVICESAFSEDDSLIAQRYLVEKVAQVDIAAELEWDRATISHHLKYCILPAVERVAKRLYT
jgi:hypothetical protein